MKFYKIVLFASLILSIYSDDGCDPDDSSVSKAKDCNKHDSTGRHCCYYKVKKDGDTKNGCLPLTQTQYDNIKDFIKTYKDAGYEVKKLDCKSIYLELSILSFILLLL